MKPLDPKILRQTLRGYAEVNRITELERVARLKKITDQEAKELFNRICQNIPDLDYGTEPGLFEYRIFHHLKVREAIERLARAGGYESTF